MRVVSVGVIIGVTGVVIVSVMVILQVAELVGHMTVWVPITTYISTNGSNVSQICWPTLCVVMPAVAVKDPINPMFCL
jgi:hypothetical protein